MLKVAKLESFSEIRIVIGRIIRPFFTSPNRWWCEASSGASVVCLGSSSYQVVVAGTKEGNMAQTHTRASPEFHTGGVFSLWDVHRSWGDNNAFQWACHVLRAQGLIDTNRQRKAALGEKKQQHQQQQQPQPHKQCAEPYGLITLFKQQICYFSTGGPCNGLHRKSALTKCPICLTVSHISAIPEWRRLMQWCKRPSAFHQISLPTASAAISSHAACGERRPTALSKAPHNQGRFCCFQKALRKLGRGGNVKAHRRFLHWASLMFLFVMEFWFQQRLIIIKWNPFLFVSFRGKAEKEYQTNRICYRNASKPQLGARLLESVFKWPVNGLSFGRSPAWNATFHFSS